MKGFKRGQDEREKVDIIMQTDAVILNCTSTRNIGDVADIAMTILSSPEASGKSAVVILIQKPDTVHTKDVDLIFERSEIAISIGRNEPVKMIVKSEVETTEIERVFSQIDTATGRHPDLGIGGYVISGPQLEKTPEMVDALKKHSVSIGVYSRQEKEEELKKIFENGGKYRDPLL